MGAIVVVLLVALALAAVVMLYAAYPYRGEDTPLAPMLGRAMRRGVDSLPTLDPESGPERPVSLSRSMVDAQAESHR